MRRPGLILRQEDATQQAKAVATEVTELAAHVFRVALTDTLGAQDGERFSDALDRRIDARIRTHTVCCRCGGFADGEDAYCPKCRSAIRKWWRFWA